MARSFRAVWDCHDSARQRTLDDSIRPRDPGKPRGLRIQVRRASAHRDGYSYPMWCARKTLLVLSICAMRTLDLQVEMTGLERAGGWCSASRHATSGVQRARQRGRRRRHGLIYAHCASACRKIDGSSHRATPESRACCGQHAPAIVGPRREVLAWAGRREIRLLGCVHRRMRWGSGCQVS